MNQTDWGLPRPRHQYTYHPRPYPGQKGVLTYSGPLNMTAAAQGYGAYGTAGYGMGGYGAYGAAGAAYSGYGSGYGAYGVRPSYTPSYNSYYSSTPYGYANQYPTNYHYGGYGQGHHMHYGRYANYFHPFQSSYGAGALVPYSSYSAYAAYPATTTYVATTTAGAQAQNSTATATANPTTIQYAYVQAAATPTKLPDAYRTVNYTSRARTVTAEDIQFENRRVATERGAYRPRKIKPADAKPDDVFWVHEKNGDWHCRPYYQIEEFPGTWQMDAEIGFLVFHRE